MQDQLEYWNKLVRKPIFASDGLILPVAQPNVNPLSAEFLRDCFPKNPTILSPAHTFYALTICGTSTVDTSKSKIDSLQIVQTGRSLLRIAQMRFIRKRCLLLRLRYLSLMILKVLIRALMFSMTIRSFDNSRLNNFCPTVNGCPLLFLCGMRLLACNAKELS